VAAVCSPTTGARLFRTVAIAEAVSWAGLLIGMFVTDVVIDDIGVTIFGRARRTGLLADPAVVAVA
jgi:hypothetical protein